jgi:UDP-2-acetamido-2,6-beta-L-arabino-hexul-4-ose reductase
MRILITGSNGFIGKNLYQYLLEIPNIEIFTFTRNEEPSKLLSIIEKVDFVFHLAGVNRPKDPDDFIATNVHFTKSLIELIKIETSTKKRRIGFVFTSSMQAELQNPYGESKKKAEDILIGNQFNDIFYFIYRLPNVFGKWSLPNYNSVVATFCHNIANNLDIKVYNPDTQINLLYIEDLILSFGRLLDEFQSNNATPNYSFIDLHDSTFTIKLAELASLITSFKNSRISLESERALFELYILLISVICQSIHLGTRYLNMLIIEVFL